MIRQDKVDAIVKYECNLVYFEFRHLNFSQVYVIKG